MSTHDPRARRQLYYRHFIPYGILALLVIAVTCALLFIKAVENVRQDVDEQMASALHVASDFMETQFEELDRAAFDILSDPTLKPYSLFMDRYAMTQASQALTSFVNANLYLHDILLLFSEETTDAYGAQRLFYTKSGPLAPHTLWEYVYSFSSMGYSAFESLLPSVNKPLILYPFHGDDRRQPTDYLLYAVPMQVDPDGVNRRGVILFLLNTAAMDAFFEPMLGIYEGTLRVLDPQGGLLYRVGFAGREDIPFDATVPLPADVPAHQRVEGGVERVALRATPRDWRLVMDWYNSPYDGVQRNALLVQVPVFLLLLTVGLVGALLLSRIHFKPLSQVYDSLAVYGRPPAVSFRGIVSSLKEMEAHWDRLKYQMNTQRGFCHMQLVRNLLCGQFQSVAQLEEQLRDNELSLRADQYTVCVLKLPKAAEGQAPPVPQAALCQYVEQLQRVPGELRFCLAMDEGERVTVLIGLPASVDMKTHIQGFFAALCGGMEQGALRMPTLGVGDTAPTLAQVPAAYQQALARLEDAFLLGHGRILSETRTGQGMAGEIVWYPTVQEEKLVDALGVGDWEQAKAQVRELCDTLTVLFPPAYVARSICLGVQSRVAAHARAMHLALDEEAVARMERQVMGGGFCLLDVEVALLALCEGLCEQVLAARQEKGPQLCDQVEAYLGQNYGDATLSLQDIAAHFDRSAGHLARLYKQQRSKTIVQHLDEIRLEQAKVLLAEGHLTLDEVIARCGYVDKNNFIRKFKKCYQQTPGRYGELHRKG